MRSLHPTVILLLVGLACLVGCTKPLTRQDPIQATNDEQFQAWVDQHRSLLSEAELRELTEARQLVRFRTMQSRPGLPRDEFTSVVYADINGKPFTDLLILGCELQIDRVSVELENYRPLVERFEKFRNDRSLDDDQRRESEEKLKHLNQRVREHREELDRLTKHLEELKRSQPPKSA